MIYGRRHGTAETHRELIFGINEREFSAAQQQHHQLSYRSGAGTTGRLWSRPVNRLNSENNVILDTGTAVVTLPPRAERFPNRERWLHAIEPRIQGAAVRRRIPVQRGVIDQLFGFQFHVLRRVRSRSQ